MQEMETKENQIIHGVIWKQLLIFFFPILLGTFFQQIYNTADTVVVGRFVGTEALAAVGGSTSQIINLIVGFFTGLASGATGCHLAALWCKTGRWCAESPAYCICFFLWWAALLFPSWEFDNTSSAAQTDEHPG